MSPKNNQIFKTSKKSLWSAVLMIVALVAILSLTLFYYTASTPIYKYAIVIDAGSTHSEATLFRWKADKLNRTGIIDEMDSCEIKKGISTYTQSQLDHAANQLVDCINRLKQTIDPDEAKDTLVYLGATAGMRVLNLTDHQHASQILDSIHKHFKAEKLNSKSVSVINGTYEGIYAWVASNYLAQTFFTPQNTYGVLDMGGASAQIAHEVAPSGQTKSHPTNYKKIKLYGKTYTISSYSNLCFGTEQALNRYYTILLDNHLQSTPESATIESACFNHGHRVKLFNLNINNGCTEKKQEKRENPTIDYEFVGSGDVDKCREIVDSIVKPADCTQFFKICLNESFDEKEGQFYAISSYAYLTAIFNATGPESLSMKEYLTNTNEICKSSLDKIVANPNYSRRHREYYCFRLTFVYSTLTNVYHFDEQAWKKLKFSKKIQQKSIGWSLGYIIDQSNAIPAGNGTEKVMNYNLYATCCAILAIIFVISCAWFGYSIKNIRRQKQLQLDEFSKTTMA